MINFINNLPKAELHLHIEGTFEPELMFNLATKNNIKLPYQSIEELKKAYNFDNLQHFLDIYYKGTSVLIEEQDFYDLTYNYLKKCASQQIRHVEIMFDPQSHTSRGVNFETIINGISKACLDAERSIGVTSLLIMSFLRHLSEEEAIKTLKQSLPFKKNIKAVGLDSSEKNNPPSKFQHVFLEATKQGYIPVAHAGEEGPSEYIWEAIELLKVKRIDHGNNALNDLDLIDTIKNRNIPLTICPLSNLALKVVDKLEEHPLKKLLDSGLEVTINSDDPAYFGGQLNKNYIEIQKALNLTKFDLYNLAKNSFQHSFLNDDKKEQYLTELEVYYNKNK
ncbi:adenosine deaminase [uncultured Lutibacter sp.]|uniref:adenosine deaminase n=1 Tax=uncultured Lutibacter sp. TaxID=437739 RepID=UPI00261C17D9|nr:adenosine deaminase [uncultured Lutibacter sp.]